MSESKTLYTMAEIKESIKNLMYKSIQETSDKIDSEFIKHIENEPALELDLKAYDNAIDTIRNLESKYEEDRYRRSFDKDELRSIMRRKFRKQFREMESKIRSQFTCISDRLSKMRNPNTALEFLKACGIVLPEKVQPVVSIKVDPEFIKSILPKQNLLTDGAQEGVENEV